MIISKSGNFYFYDARVVFYISSNEFIRWNLRQESMLTNVLINTIEEEC